MGIHVTRKQYRALAQLGLVWVKKERALEPWYHVPDVSPSRLQLCNQCGFLGLILAGFGSIEIFERAGLYRELENHNMLYTSFSLKSFEGVLQSTPIIVF